MTIAKRIFTAFCAFALCAAMSLGSLSFLPKSFAFSPPSSVTFDYLDIPSGYSPVAITSSFDNISSGSSWNNYYLVFLVPSGTSISFARQWPSNSTYQFYLLASCSSSFTYYSIIADSSGHWTSSLSSRRSSSFSSSWQLLSGFNSAILNRPYPSPDSIFVSSGSSSSSAVSGFFDISFRSPPLGHLFFNDFSPFYFPELPHGEFDGNINVVDGQYSIDLGSVTGTSTNTGDTTTFEHYQFNIPSVTSDFDMVHQSAYTTYDGTISTPAQTVTGQTTNTVHYVESGSVDINGSAPVSYQPSFNDNSRFRCWSCVMDSSYVWFVSDTRNKITGSIVSVTSNEVTWKYEFADPQGGNTIYPIWAVVFSPMGEVIQVLSPTTASNKNVYTLSCSIGTLEQDQDTGIWSCDPLYHGFWFSDDAPPVQGITSLQVAENKKVLANPVFGDEAFTLNFLNAINENITGLRSD